MIYLTQDAQNTPQLYKWIKHSGSVIALPPQTPDTLIHTSNNSLPNHPFQHIDPPQILTSNLSFQDPIVNKLNRIYYESDSPILHINPSELSQQELGVIKIFNYLKQGDKSNQQLCQMYVSGGRNSVLSFLLKLIVGCFLTFILIHYYLYRLILLLLKPLNSLLGVIGYCPLVMVQNQMTYKCNLIGSQLQDSLKFIFEINQQEEKGINTFDTADRYKQVLSHYLKIVNILTFMVIDSALGLASVFLTYYSITLLVSSLKYITQTLHLLLINNKTEITSLKEIVSGNIVYNKSLQYLFQIFLEKYPLYFDINLDSKWFFNIYLLVGYLGFSFQILFTIQFSYLTSINIFILYKIITWIYQLTLNLLRFCTKIVQYSEEVTITTKLEEWMKEPWFKLLSLLIIIFFSVTLPLTLVYYLWLVSIIILFKTFINLLTNIVIVLNNLSLGEILITIKKPYLYPAMLNYEFQSKRGRLELRIYNQGRGKRIWRLTKELIENLYPLISIKMVKEIISGKDLLKQPALDLLDPRELMVKRVFSSLMKI